MSASRPLRLVVLLEDLEFGGTQRYALQLLRHIDRDLFTPEVWLLRGGSGFLADMEATGTRVVFLTRGRHVGPWALLRLASRLGRHRPDLVYTLTALPNIWGRPLAALFGIPVVSGYRNLYAHQHERLLNRFCVHSIANAAALERVMVEELGISPERITVVPNAVDGQHFSPDPGERSATPLVVCVARQAHQKDIPTLLAAFRRTRAAIPDARLEIIGDGRLRFDPARGVQFLAGRRDVRPSLRRSWLLTLSSAVDEGMPNAVLEAMACGLPVVATNVGGVPEVVTSGETGLVVPPRDPVALGDALTRLLQDEVLRGEMGDAGRRRALEDFSVPRMVRATEAVLVGAANHGTLPVPSAESS